jgi:intein-encoded DNA endonuclease-like protein
MEDTTMDNQQGKQPNVIHLLAYSLGAFLGDGYFKYHYYGNGGWWMIEVSTMDREIVETVREQIKSVFNADYTIKHRTLKSGVDFWTYRSTRKVIYDVFTSVTSLKTQIPQDIINAPRSVVIDFIAGLFDTDGTIVHNKEDRFQVKFGSTNKPLVECVASLLQRHGVMVGKIGEYTKSGYRTGYSIQPNIRSFIEAGFNFRVQRKLMRLGEYLIKVGASETMHAAPVTSGDDIVQS